VEKRRAYFDGGEPGRDLAQVSLQFIAPSDSYLRRTAIPDLVILVASREAHRTRRRERSSADGTNVRKHTLWPCSVDAMDSVFELLVWLPIAAERPLRLAARVPRRLRSAPVFLRPRAAMRASTLLRSNSDSGPTMA
jgi:hypothetical protein